MSTSVLSQRLGELREAALVEKDAAGTYALTEPGSRLLARLDGVDEWTQEWARMLGGSGPTGGRLSAPPRCRVLRVHGTRK